MDNKKIQDKISIWMSELFEKNITRKKVDEYIELLIIRIANAKLKKHEITEELFKQLCESIENEF